MDASLIDVLEPRPPRRPRLREIASAASDEELFRLFVSTTVDHEPTAKNYSAQLLRLSWFIRRMRLASVRELQTEDWIEFQRYLANPPVDHIMTASFPREHPQWRPFRCALKPSSVVQACVVIKSFTKWMAAHKIIDEDPFATKRNKAGRIGPSAKDFNRRLLSIDWAFVQQAIEAMPTHRLTHVQAQARARWIMTLAVLSGLRASEIANAKAQDLKCIDGYWVIESVRKGRVLSRIPVSSTVLESHRLYCDLCKVPSTGPTPLVASIRHKDPTPIDRKRLWSIVKSVFLAASELALQHNNVEASNRLRFASTHWLRHSFANWLTDVGADLRTTRDLLDHADLTTTNQYLHSEKAAMRSAIENLAGLFKTGFAPPQTNTDL